ncbi:MAG: diaminopimelate epimerase [Nocardioides sp.]|uniref:diaminopimelate epimerase n=1 Tax=Nocardioides sp. TaxID=35761 RepID=UPI0039E40C2B
MSGPGYEFVKGHGTENDFVLLPDPDGSVHGELSVDRVRALCDRHAGIGADGVLRVVRTAAYPGADRPASAAEWFMDYRNADGSRAEMCGNGTRVFAEYLSRAGLADPDGLTVATRAGDRSLHRNGAGEWTVDLGRPGFTGWSQIEVTSSDRTWRARGIDLGNPHAVVFLDACLGALDLTSAPGHDPAAYPNGVNVEFVERAGEGRLRMRVHERGVGETRSCGTGVGAAALAAMEADGAGGAGGAATYLVEVPGGRLGVTWTDEDRVLLAGPAALVATGHTDL